MTLLPSRGTSDNALIDALKQALDYRKVHGRSHLLWILLLLMGKLAGCHRPLQTFIEEHQKPLCQLFKTELYWSKDAMFVEDGYRFEVSRPSSTGHHSEQL